MDMQATLSFLYTGPLATRMACHLGERKASVICNVLGDQPLFYIDYIDEEEADFMDPMSLLEAEAEHMATDIDTLRRRMARLEGASQHIDAYKKESADVDFDAAVAAFENGVAETTLADVTTFLETGRLTSSMLSDGRARGLAIIMNAQVDTATYDRDQMTIHINPRLPASVATLAAARALRQAWLHLQGAAIHPLHFAPEEAVLLNRIQQADAVCAVIRAAWELNLGGNKDSWSRLITGSAYDLAVGFAREAIADFRALNNGQASHAAFERWFFSGRCKDVDRKLIQQMLADQHGLVFDNPHVSRMVTNDIIARTGDQPVGKNYLTGLVDIIVSDPLFTEVRDRSNANFLWFIKFERSFRASEDNTAQNLQGLPQIPAGAAQGASQMDGAANAVSGEVVAFKGAFNKRKSGKNGSDEMATVYYLDHFHSLSNR